MAKMKDVTVRGYNEYDVPAMAEIWNEVVEKGKVVEQADCGHIVSELLFCAANA